MRAMPAMNVDTHLERAVAAQLVAEQKRTGSPPIEDVLGHLSDSGVFAGNEMPDVSAR